MNYNNQTVVLDYGNVAMDESLDPDTLALQIQIKKKELEYLERLNNDMMMRRAFAAKNALATKKLGDQPSP